MKQLDEEQRTKAVNLYRLVLWTDLLRIQFETALARDQKELERRLQAKQFILDVAAIESDMYIRLWFGFLYVVVEGWRQLKLKQDQPPQIKEMLKNPYTDLLRKFRNATFHPAEFDNPDIQNLVAKGQEAVDWARKLTLEFKLFFESILVLP